MSRRLGAALAAIGLCAVTAGPTFAATHPPLVCNPPSVQQLGAPALGTQTSYPAASAGSVVVQRVDTGTLQVVAANPNGGWTDQVMTGSGPRDKVKFLNAAGRQVTRFAAALNKKGTQVHVRVTECHH
jgi:hypothetical protein